MILKQRDLTITLGIMEKLKTGNPTDGPRGNAEARNAQFFSVRRLILRMRRSRSRIKRTERSGS